MRLLINHVMDIVETLQHVQDELNAQYDGRMTVPSELEKLTEFHTSQVNAMLRAKFPIIQRNIVSVNFTNRGVYVSLPMWGEIVI